MKDWYKEEINDIFKFLGTGDKGLSLEEVKKRISEHGKNTLPESKPESYVRIFFRQFQSPLIYLLIAAAIAVFYMGEYTDGIVIVFVLLFNSVIGTFQEGRAQNTLLAIKKFSKTEATVIRGGKEYIVSGDDITVGDILIIQEGEKVSADARVIESRGLALNESALTGESEPVHKTQEIVPGDNLQIHDRRNMVFKGTDVTSGHGKVVVTAVGTETHIGKITKQLATIDTEIPLKADIRKLARIIIFSVLFIIIAIFLYGVSVGVEKGDMFRTVISLAVSIVPEGLPAVLTVVLAAGVWRMSKKNALVKRLQAVEALGQAKIIAVDKTGTVTRNELSVVSVYTSSGGVYEIAGSGYEPSGEIKENSDVIEPMNHEDLLLIGRVAALSSTARLSYVEDAKQWKVMGDPTEGAMLVLSKKIGFERDNLINESPLLFEMPFDYHNKYHITAFRGDGKTFVAAAGAPEVILNKSNKFFEGDNVAELREDERKRIMEKVANLSDKGLRILALAYAEEGQSLSGEEISQSSLIYVGLIAMQDTLRPEVMQAVERAKGAGMKLVMITGDNPNTAKSIATQIGIFKEGDEIMTGSEIENFEPKVIAKKLEHVTVFARVTPEHKLKIIQAYRLRKEIVAMTGDGVNDAPSLQAADLGVAMGKIGTDVAKEASDIILLDDNFGSIITAIEEGRNIYKSIKRVVLYLISTSVGEVLAISGALLFGWPLLLLPAQIIWLNLVTDSFLDIGLALEPKSEGWLHRSFVKKDRQVVDGNLLLRTIFMAIPMAVVSLSMFYIYLNSEPLKAWTVALTVLATMQWFNAWNCRYERRSMFSKGFFSNKYLVIAVFITISLQVAAVYTPFLQQFLKTVALSPIDWVGIVAGSLSIVIFEELRKLVARILRPI